MDNHEYEYEDPWISMNMNIDSMNNYDNEHDYEMNFKVHEFIWIWIWCSWTVWLWKSSWIWHIWLWITMSSMNKNCKFYESIWVWIWNFMNMNHMTMNHYEQYEPNFIGCMTFHEYGWCSVFCSESLISYDSHSCLFSQFYFFRGLKSSLEHYLIFLRALLIVMNHYHEYVHMSYE